MLGKIISLTMPGVEFLRPVGPMTKFKPKRKYTKRKKTTCEGRVVSVCIKLWNGQIKSYRTPCTHVDVMLRFEIQAHEILRTGWLLDNGRYLWR